MENNSDDVLARRLDNYMTGRSVPSDGATPESTQLERIADLLWEAAHGAPPLEQDPVAALLGLVPDAARSLSSAAVKRALRASGLQVSALAERLSARGWDVTTRDVFNWQTRDDATVPPALIQAIAEETGTSPDELTIDLEQSPGHRRLKAVTSSKRFLELAERWARLRGTTVNLGAAALEARLATSVHRGSQPTEAQMLASLDAMISALESELP